MKRGTVLVGRAPGDFTSKPRPYLVVQSADVPDRVPTLTVCPITSTVIGIGRIRVEIGPDAANGLKNPSEIEVDRLTTMRRESFKPPIGRAAPDFMRQVDASLRRWLDL